jgi:hypothetical protein
VPVAVVAPTLSRAAADSAVKAERYTGLWTPALLAKRLVESGMAVTLTDSIFRYQHLSVEGKFIKLGRGDLYAFFYSDTLQAGLEVARLDSATAAPPGITVPWTMPPTLARSLNLIVIFLSDSPGSSERVSNAILGGLAPPEPNK